MENPQNQKDLWVREGGFIWRRASAGGMKVSRCRTLEMEGKETGGFWGRIPRQFI
jgi:hypothetical protein